MKNKNLIFASLLILATIFMGCKKEVVKPPVLETDYPELTAVDGKVLIVAYFEEAPCNDVVFIGSNNGWNTDDVSKLAKFQPVGKVGEKVWDGWYKVVIDTVGAAAEEEGIMYKLAGKPVQLTKDGAFDWGYQVGYDAESDVVKKAGEVDIYPGFAGECDIYYGSTTEPVVLVFKKWKKNPCVDAPKHNYTFTVTVPAGTPAEAVVRIVGDFKDPYPSWAADGANMALTKQANGTYTITLNGVEEGTQYKYVLNGSWDNEELAAIEAGAECAKAIDNRTTGSSAAIADKVENWKGVTATRCE